jgi:hypothetical protein
MKMFATLSYKALKAVIDNKYVGNATASDATTNTPMSTTRVEGEVERVCEMIERSIYIAEKQKMTNCGMEAFPWLKELVPFATYLTQDCRVRIASGFKSRLFTALDTTSQVALMQALIIDGPPKPKGPTDNIAPKSIMKTSLLLQTTEVSPDGSCSSSSFSVHPDGNRPTSSSSLADVDNGYVVRIMNFVGIMLITKLVRVRQRCLYGPSSSRDSI